ncbi:MAG: hypothetical protein KA444_02070 [Bacteroidia bacterium]|nr:hypothetical protein [Bacteroidia bacterium]
MQKLTLHYQKFRILLSVILSQLIFIFFPFNISAAQNKGSEFTDENISLAQGLSQSSVFCISQDQKGFIWAGTQDGLNKYDGIRFKTFYNIPFDSTSLSSGHVISMLHDSKGRFWIGTSNHGLNLFIPDGEKFKSFQHRPKDNNSILNNTIHVIHEGPGGTIWLGTGNGLQRVVVDDHDPKNPTVEFETVFRDTSRTALFAITTIFENQSGEVWIGTLRGLLKLTFKGSDNLLPAEAAIYTKADGLNSDEVMSFVTDPQGNYWVGTSQGISVINAQTNKILFVPIPSYSSKSIKTEVNNLYLSSEGTLWIASGSGLFTLSPEEIKNVFKKIPQPVYFKTQNNKHNSGVMCVHEDKISRGIMWLGTGVGGIVKLVSKKDKNIYTNHLTEISSPAFVFSLAKDKEGIVWIGTTDGLIRFNRSTNSYAIFRYSEGKKNQLRNNYITTLRLDQNDDLWVGTLRGLHRVKNRNSKNPDFEFVQVNPQLAEVSIREIVPDKNGDLLIVLPGKLFKLSLKDSKMTMLTHAFKGESRLPFGFIYMSALVDRNENIWLGSSMGLYIYLKQAGKEDPNFSSPILYQHDSRDTTSLRSHTINDLFEDSQGNVWISTPNGLTKAEFRNKKMKFTNYSTRDGLKNNAVYGVLENPVDNTLWMSTNGGLSKFDPRKIKFSNYDINDGLQSNEFNGGAYFRSHDNEFLFGGINGYSSFYPHEIKEDTVAPRVFITSFALAGESEEMLSLDKSKEMELNYNQNSFQINFIALQYSNPSQNKYAYKLDGFQKEWTQNGTNSRVNFTHLPPGKYVFHVTGANANGVFSKASDTISIIIHPPFWKTIWFYILIALCIGLVAWLLHAYLLRLKLKQVEEIEAIRKETAADFHDELGHKLTTISWFGEILKKKISPEQKELRAHLERIIDTSGGLYHTMKDMVWAMDPGQDSMKDLYKQIREFGESLFDQTGVDFKARDLNGEFKEVSIPLAQKRHVLLICKEAMHNSFKHSGGKQVTLDIFRENNHFTITLGDNGKGFNMNWDETGNGLRNVRKRTEEIGGKLKIVSNPEGTTLELEVPLKS